MANVVFYIADGEKHIREVRQSAESLKRHMPDVKTMLFTPGISVPAYIDETIQTPPRTSEMWFLDATRYMYYALSQFSVGDKVVCLDSDTYVAAPFPELFEMLDRVNLAAAHAPGRFTGRSLLEVPASFPEVNIGVMAWQVNRTTINFCEHWYYMYEKNSEAYGNNDQGPLRDCLWTNTMLGMPFCVLPPEYNCRPLPYVFLSGEAKILHFRDDDMAARADEINASKEMRIWKHQG